MSNATNKTLRLYAATLKLAGRLGLAVDVEDHVEIIESTDEDGELVDERISYAVVWVGGINCCESAFWYRLDSTGVFTLEGWIPQANYPQRIADEKAFRTFLRKIVKDPRVASFVTS